MRFTRLCLLTLSIALAPLSTARADEPPPAATHIHFEANSPEVMLFRRDAEGGEVVPLCKAPCDSTLTAQPGRSYYFAGPEIPRSAPIDLEASTGNVEIAVRAGNAWAKRGGVLLTVLGGAGLVGSSFLAIYASWDPGSGPPQRWTPGLVLAGGGAAASIGLLAGGIYTIVSNKTSYRVRHVAAGPGGIALRF